MDAVPINPLVQQSFNAQAGRQRGFGQMPQQQGPYPFANLNGGYASPTQYPSSYGQLPPQFRTMMQGVGARSSGNGFSGGNKSMAAMPVQQQQSQFPFQLPQYMGLGDFYTPHGMGDAQNVPNSGPMANFIGNQWQNSQWGQTPQNQYLPPMPGGGRFLSLPRGGRY